MNYASHRTILKGVEDSNHEEKDLLHGCDCGASRALEMYMKEHRQQYLAMRENLMQDADLVVDGMQSVEVLAKQVVEELRRSHH